jgi:hypothetical protein
VLDGLVIRSQLRRVRSDHYGDGCDSPNRHLLLSGDLAKAEPKTLRHDLVPAFARLDALPVSAGYATFGRAATDGLRTARAGGLDGP